MMFSNERSIIVYIVLLCEWNLLCFLDVKYYFLKNEQDQKGENILQIIPEKLNARKSIN